jgi:hypothetical protein
MALFVFFDTAKVRQFSDNVKIFRKNFLKSPDFFLEKYIFEKHSQKTHWLCPEMKWYRWQMAVSSGADKNIWPQHL